MEGYVQSCQGVYTLKPRSMSVGRHREPDLCLQVTCQCVCQRSACPGYLHVTEDPKTVPLPAVGSPQLPALTSLSPSIPSGGWILGSSRTFPRPPPRQRATSGSNTRTSESLSTDTHPQPPVARHGGWTDLPAGGQAEGDGASVSSGQPGQHLLQEKEKLIVRMGDEIKRLCEFESESKRKDSTIAQLRSEMESLRQATSHTEPDTRQRNLEIAQKLQTLGCDIEAKTTEIEALKEQLNNLEKGSSELLVHSLKEKDLEIVQLRNQTKSLKRNNSMTSGLMTSLHRDLAAREQQVLRATSEAETLRKKMREKDSQIAAMSAKFSRMRESRKIDDEEKVRESELVTLRHMVEELRSEVQSCRGELESVNTSRAEEKQVRERQQKELVTSCQQLQVTEREARQLKTQLQQTQARLERFQSRIIQTTYSTPGVPAPRDLLTDQQVLEQMKQIIAERSEWQESLQEIQSQREREDRECREREERECQEREERQEQERKKREQDEREREKRELEERERREREEMERERREQEEQERREWECRDREERECRELEERNASVERLRRALEESQVGLQRSWCEAAVGHGEGAVSDKIQTLRGLEVEPFLQPLHSTFVAILSRELAWQQEMEQQLQNTGHQGTASGLGMAGYVSSSRELCENTEQQSCVDRVPSGGEAVELVEEQGIDEETRQVQPTAEEQHSQSLMEDVAQERRRREEIELRLIELNEAVEVKGGEIEALTLKLSSVSQELSRARNTEERLREEMASQERGHRAEMETALGEAERGRRLHQEEAAEFREQIRQHAHTIVALELRVRQLTQQQLSLEQENTALRGRVRDAEDNVEQEKTGARSPSPVSAVASPDLELACTHLRMELAEAGEHLRTQQVMIEGLRRLLATANASMSDLAGELSEKQKEELEQQRGLSEVQAQALGSLQGQLASTSRLLQEKEQEIQDVNVRLRKCEESLAEARQAVSKKTAECQNLQDMLSRGQSDLKQLRSTTEQEPLTSELAVLGLECKGRRHEEVIQRQRAALGEMRSRVTSAETCAARAPRERERGAGTRSLVSEGLNGEALGKQENLRLASATISEASIERTSRLEMSEALDLSEMTYLDMVKALSKALNMTELSGSLSMKHIPRDERERLGRQRRTDLETLSSQITQLQTQLERKEQLLLSYEKDLEQLRQQQELVHRQKCEIERLQTELQRQIQENELIRESLRRAQARLDQEKRLNKAIKQRKTFHLEQLEKRGGKLVSHTCVQDTLGQAPAKQKAMEEKLKRKGYEIEKLKNELRKQDQELCHTTSQLINLQLASRMTGSQNPDG